MGVSCQIFRDRNGSIERVETPDGRPSALYQEALAYTQNEKEALDLWTVNYLTEFRESMIPFDIKRTEPQFQIIGEVGANNIPMYRATLESAKRLEAAGRSPEEIEQNTKWYKSNGQWKRLSPETVAQFKINRNPINQELTLKEVIGDGSILFQIYPQLGDTKVVFYDLNREGAPTNLPKDAEGALGMYIQKNGTVYVNTDFKGQRRVDSEQTYTLAHELSHRIQDIEGFPNGGGPFSLVAEAYNILSVEENTNLQKLEQLIKDSDKSNLTSNEKKILKDALVAIDAIKTGNQQVLQNQYRHLMGEIDAHVVENAYLGYNRGDVGNVYEFLLEAQLEDVDVINENALLRLDGEGVSYFIPSAQPAAPQEATLDQILDYVEAVNAAEVGSLNQTEVQEVKGILRTLDVPNSEVLAREISRVFTHGNLNENFNSSEMFSEFDKEVIRANQEYQNNLRELGHKINNTEETVYNNESFEEDFLLYDGTTNSYGIGVSQNPLIVEENIRQQVGGMSDRDSFDSAFNEIQYESIVDQFNSDEAFAQRMFDKFSTLTRVSSFTLENGALTETQEINKTKTVENTADLDRTNLSEDIQFLTQIPVEVWEVSGTEIQQGLDQIEDKAETAGMDFNGLKQSYGSKTRTQILNFLTTVNNVEKQPTPENFEAFLEAYSEFFEVDSTPKVQVEDISSENASKTLVGVENPSSEYDMFNTHSLVKVDNNLYQRVNKVPLETMYEIFYSEVLVNDNRMLPDAAYRMSNTELKKPENKVFAINNIEIFLQNNIGQLELGTTIFDTDTVQQLLAYKYYYGNPMTVEAVDNMAEDMTAIQDFDGNSQYLTTEYHTDFQVAKMKSEGTAKYNSVYSKLHIGDNGIVPINTDSISMEQLRAGIQEDLTAKERKDLKNYSVVSKNRDMKTLFPREDSQFTIPSKPQERQYYRNNPKALNDFTGKYRTFEGGLVTTDTGADFIRVGDRLYERTQGVADSSFYREILTVNSNFNMIENDVKAINKFEHNDIIPYLRTSETVEKTNNIYTKSELAEIDQSKFDCQ